MKLETVKYFKIWMKSNTFSNKKNEKDQVIQFKLHMSPVCEESHGQVISWLIYKLYDQIYIYTCI